MDVTGATWRTSSYTGSGGGNCVEVANHPQDGRILIRDTKNRSGPVLAFSSQAWRLFAAKSKSRLLQVQMRSVAMGTAIRFFALASQN
jgi:hypothetical protein